MGENEINPNVWLAEYAKILSLPKKELLVLAPNNDPFNCGSPAQVEAARWFAGVYERLGYRGIHLRRLHYRAYDAGVLTVSGEEYPNTEKQWTDLQNASRYARYLGLVDPGDFVDMRAPTPSLSVSGVPDIPEPTYEVEASDSLLEWYLPSIGTDLTASLEVDAEYRVDGYYYAHDMQPTS